MQTNLWQIIPPSFALLNLESAKRWKVWKGKLRKFEYLKHEKSFLDEMKNIFHKF